MYKRWMTFFLDFDFYADSFEYSRENHENKFINAINPFYTC